MKSVERHASNPNRRRPRTRKRLGKVAAPVPARPQNLDANYQTNVAPDLIAEGRPIDRSAAPDSQCSLPPENGAGTAD